MSSYIKYHIALDNGTNVRYNDHGRDQMAEKKKLYGDGSIYQRKDGRWVAQYAIPGGGKRYLYGRSSKEVERKLRDLKRSPEFIVTQNTSNATVEEYANYWVETYKKDAVKGATYTRLRSTLKNQIIPVIGGTKISRLTSKECQDLITDLQASGASYSVVKKTYDFLSAMMKHATLNEDISRNPMLTVSSPSQALFDTKEVRVLSEAEEQMLLEELSKTWSTGSPKYSYRDAFTVILNTGLREGELVALDWDDIDLSKRTMHVQKTIVMVNERDDKGELTGRCYQNVQSTPKTRSGNRVVPLNMKAIAALKSLHEAHPKSPYVLTSENGQRPMCNVLNKQLKRAGDRCGIYGITPHALRHTFATRLFEKGADIKTVSTILGHSSINITYNTYVHVIQDKKFDTVNLLD